TVDKENISVVDHSEAVIEYDPDTNVITVSGLDVGEYTLKVVTTPDDNHKSVENTASVTVNKIDSDITLSKTDLEFDYDDMDSVEITGYDGCSVDAENITVVGQSGALIAFENNMIYVSNLDAGDYTLRIVTTPDKNHKSVEKTANIIVNKIDSSVSFSNVVVFDYEGSNTTALTLDGCTVDKKNITVVDHPEAVISYEGNVVNVSGLDAGEYILKVVTTPDDNHKSVENTVSVTVNKIDSDITLSKSDIVFDYDDMGYVTVSGYVGCSVDVENITVVGQSAGIAFENDIIVISDLNAGTYTLKIVTTPDKNHKSVVKTANIKVDKIDSEVTFSNAIIFAYEDEGSTIATCTGCTIDLENITIVGHDEAIIKLDNNRITVSNLSEDKYTLKVVTTPDKNHKSVEATLGVTVSGISPKMSVQVNNITVGEKEIVFITMGTEATGDVNITIMQGTKVIQTRNITISNRFNKTEFENLPVGKYTITAHYYGTTNYNEVTVPGEFIVRPIYTFEFNATAKDTVWGNKTNVTVSLPSDATGTIKIGNIETPIEGPSTLIELPVQTVAGKNNVTVKYVPDANSRYSADEITVFYNVAKRVAEISIADIAGVKAGDDVSVVVTAYDGADIVVYVDGVETSTVENIAAGTHTVVATVAETDSYLAASATKTFTVTKNDVEISVSGSETKAGEKSTITVDITDGATGIVVINVNGSEYSLNISKTKQLEVVMPTVGNVPLSARYLGDDKYNAKDADPATISVSEKSERTDIVIPDLSNVKVDDELNITVPEGVDVYVDGIKQTPKDGNVSVPTTAGNHTVVIVADETPENKAVFEVVNYTVSKHDVDKFEISAEPTKAGEKSTITVDITDGATGIVVVKVGDEEYSLNISETNELDVVMPTAGDIPLSAKYLGDEKYNAKDITGDDIKVSEKASANITVSGIPSKIEVGDSFNVTVKADSPITVYVDGVKQIPDENDNVTVSIASAGVHNITVIADETADSQAEELIKTFEAVKKPTEITIDDISGVKAGDDVNVVVTAYDGADIVVYVDGVETSTVENIAAGTHTVVATVDETDSYLAASATKTFTVTKNDVEISVSGSETKVGEKSTIIVDITDGATGIVVINVNGSEYSLNISKTKELMVVMPTAGNVPLSARYLGDDKYNAKDAENTTIKVTEKSDRTDIVIPDLSDVKVDDKLDITVPEGVDVYVDGIKQTSKDGKVSVPTTAGNHTVVIVADETPENKAVFEVVNYTVSKHDVDKFEITAEPAVAGEKFTIAVDITDGATGIVVIDVNGTEYSIDLSDANSTEVVIDAPGKATITAKYQGDDKYNAKDSEATTITVAEKDARSDIPSIDFGDVKVGEIKTIHVPEDMDVYVDGEKLIPDENGNVTLPTDAGTHSVVIVANETATNKAVFEVGEYTVTKYNTNILLGGTPTKAGEKSTISVRVTQSDATGTVVINVNGTEYSVVLNSDGVAEIDVVMPVAGDVPVSAIYLGDYKYNVALHSPITIKVTEKDEAEIEVNNLENVEIGKPHYITIKPEDAEVYIDGVKYTPDAEGDYSIPTTEGVHTIVIRTNETTNTKAGYKVINYTVSKKESHILIDATPSSVLVGDTVTINMISDAEGTILLNVNGTIYSISYPDQYEMEITLDKPGIYTINATFMGNNESEASQSNVKTVEVSEKADSPIVVTVPEDIKVADKVEIMVTSPSGDNAEVLIDNVRYDVNNGKVVINGLSAGNHVIEVTSPETATNKANSTAKSFTVSKKEADIIISVLGDLVVDKTLRINVATYDGADVVVYLDGEKLENYNQIKATAGTHTITASVAENDEYLAATNTTSFAVDKKEAEVYVNTELATAGEPTTISLDIDEDATGIVVINVNGTEYSLNISKSKSLDVVLAQPGDYPVTAKYLGDDRFAETLSEPANIHVNDKKEPSIDIEFVTEDFYAGDDVVIAVEMDNENSTVLVDGILYEVVDGKITVENISAGDHTIEVISPETAELKPFEFSMTFGVDKREADVTITIPDDFRVGEDVVIEVSTDSDGKAVVYVDGVEQPPLRGSTTVRFSAGDHIIVATVGETDKYMQASANITFTVKKLDTTIEVKATDVTEGQSTEITLTAPLEEGIVIVQIGDKQISIDLAKSKTAKVVMDVAGKYDVSARYIGSDVYNPAEAKNSTITVSAKITPEVDVEIPDVKAGENETISVSIPNATGEVHIIIDGEDNIVPLDENGSAQYTIDEMPAGEHSIVVVYPGDETHDEVVITKQVNVPKQTSDADITVPSDVKAGEDANVKVDIPGATGSVTLIVDGKETTVPLVNGSVEYPLNNLSAGTHSVVVVYPGDDKTSSVVKSASFDVEEVPVYACEFVDVVISKDYTVSARLVSENGEGIADAVVNFTIGKTTQSVTTNADGSFNFTGENNCVIEVSYAGDDKYLPASTTITLNFTQTRKATKILGEDYTQYAVEYYAGERGQNFTTQLVDSEGNPIANKTVFIGVNGVTRERTTDANGFTSVQINFKDKNRLTFAVAFLGDDEYNGTMSVYLIIIKQKPVTITAAAKTFKATAKTKKYTVTLKTIKGASADGKTYFGAGKKVTMKINGKTYTAKTNAKGQATFSLKITKKGIYAASIKYAGDTTYNAAKASTKITIK
ncbi:Ig-like domain-containing protein, partial [Methanobrevibacter sp.]|uniref:Ig-like domain-containing protein n=1 Tax=Methanobrevibacter sp. TaxID=66852 RepID=UPI00388D9BE9